MTSAVGPPPTGYPDTAIERDRFVLGLRPKHPRRDAWRHQGVIVEHEPAAGGALATAATVFLTGRECPWRCVMCDLWRYTTLEDTPAGAIPAQLDLALSELDARSDHAACSVAKLYNAGSFFDPRAVPVADYVAIAERLVRFERVVVESHPALVGPRIDQFRDALDRANGGSAALEVAMGLETANPGALALLHKGMTLESFRRAADDLKAFMLEARMAQRPNDRDNALQEWLWGETATGGLLGRLAAKFREEGDERTAAGIAR